jgi:hypothetical protein
MPHPNGKREVTEIQLHESANQKQNGFMKVERLVVVLPPELPLKAMPQKEV